MEDREALKALMKELFAEIISEEIDPVEPIIEYDESLADVFDGISFVVRTIESECEAVGNIITVATAYSILGDLIEMALENEWLTEPDQWKTISDLFFNRSNELIDEPGSVAIDWLEIPPEKVVKIAEYILYNWVNTTRLYSRNEFTVDEKVQMIRSILIGLRNNGYLRYDPWLKSLLGNLANDWQLLGGGWGSGFGGSGFSHG